MTDGARAAGSYLRFLAWGFGAIVAAALVGYLPTLRLAGEDALPSLIAGCLVAFVASAIGAIPVARAGKRPGVARQGPQVALTAMALRLAAVVVLGAVVGLSGRFETLPLVVWIAIGHAVLLIVDTRYALAAVRE
jgi:hypothetical protein